MKTKIKDIEAKTKDSRKIIISSLSREDASDFCQCLNMIMVENKNDRTLTASYPNTLEDLKIFILNVTNSENDFILIAKIDSGIGNKVVGICDFFDSTEEDDSEQVAEIGVSIISEYQGKGIAYLLMKNCIEIAKTSTNIKKIILTVKEDKINAKNLYQKLGFKITNKNEQKKFYWMELALLHFVTLMIISSFVFFTNYVDVSPPL
ncbi:MAG: GNAT family N-acetyltransferase [Oligoflexia bacterium]|nr:GNAT family N-acetyltransferase [Oligoflexia bacterium]